MADRRLQVFHAVAKHLSFTKAAEALFMTQPAVTFQIKQLEEHYNTRLFDRGHGRISLTPAGGVVQESAERIPGLSAELETGLKEMPGEGAGPLLVGASTTIAEFLLPRVLGEFKSSYPKVVPRLFVANSEAGQDRVVAHTPDTGFIAGGARPGLHHQGGRGGAEGDRARRAGAPAPLAAPHPQLLGGVPEGAVPLAPGEHLREVRQGPHRRRAGRVTWRRPRRP